MITNGVDTLFTVGTPTTSVVPVTVGRSVIVAVLVMVAQGAVFEMTCSYTMVSVSPTLRPRVPVEGGAVPGVPAAGANARLQSVEAGIDEPTVTPVHVTAPLSMLLFAPPEVLIDVTLKLGPGVAAFGPTGSVSARLIVSPRVIGSGPLFVIATVHVALAPALIVVGETVLVIDRSY